MDETRFDRRTLVAIAGGVVLAAVEAKAGRGFPLPAATGSWELPAHDLAATRRGGQIEGTNVEWRAQLRGGAAGAPAIAGGSVFAAAIGGEIVSLDLENGRAHWRRQFATPVYGSGSGERRLGFFGGVAVDGDQVVAASDHVVALDRRPGRTIWRTTPLRTSASDDYFWGPPVIAGSLVLVGSGSGAELPTARGRLSAYSLRDGSFVWSTPTVPPGANGGGVIAPASVDLRAGLAYERDRLSVPCRARLESRHRFAHRLPPPQRRGSSGMTRCTPATRTASTSTAPPSFLGASSSPRPRTVSTPGTA